MNYVLLLGRILFGGPFILAGVHHFTALASLTQYAASKGVPMAELAVIVSGVMLILGGLSILIGFQTRIGGILLILFLVPAAFIMHAFWNETDEMAKQTHMAFFMRNISWVGAILMIMHISHWPLSIGRRHG